MVEHGVRIEVCKEGDVTVVELQDEEILDDATINDIADSIFGVVADNPGLKLLVSFAKVKHLSSSALGTLIRLNKRVDESRGVLKLCLIKPALYEIFVITKLNKLFDIYDTREMALSSF